MDQSIFNGNISIYAASISSNYKAGFSELEIVDSTTHFNGNIDVVSDNRSANGISAMMVNLGTPVFNGDINISSINDGGGSALVITGAGSLVFNGNINI